MSSCRAFNRMRRFITFVRSSLKDRDKSRGPSDAINLDCYNSEIDV